MSANPPGRVESTALQTREKRLYDMFEPKPSGMIEIDEIRDFQKDVRGWPMERFLHNFRLYTDGHHDPSRKRAMERLAGDHYVDERVFISVMTQEYLLRGGNAKMGYMTMNYGQEAVEYFETKSMEEILEWYRGYTRRSRARRQRLDRLDFGGTGVIAAHMEWKLRGYDVWALQNWGSAFA